MSGGVVVFIVDVIDVVEEVESGWYVR